MVRHVEFAPAKINLALHVVGRRLDGYHALDSFVAFADVGDELHFSESPDRRGLHLSITGPFAAALDDGPSNMVRKSWDALADRCPFEAPGMRIDLVKNLPIASGLGGGTADAAATLRGLIHCWTLTIARSELNSLAVSLGADVPVSILSTAQRMNGIGETLEPLADWRPTPAVLVNPGIQCLTADVFRAANLPPGEPAFPGLPPGAGHADAAWLRQCRNDLQTTAITLLPVIGEVIASLERCAGIEVARMSGSGATCFGLFDSEAPARAAAAEIALEHPDWWVRQTTLR